MKRSTRIKALNVMLFICILVLAITAILLHDANPFRAVHGLFGILFLIFVVIHIIQHLGWVKSNFTRFRNSGEGNKYVRHSTKNAFRR